MRTVVAAAAVLIGLAALPGQASAASGGCAAFGQHVASLATALGPTFGATASGVASSAPAAFPNGVVKPEQASFCSP